MGVFTPQYENYPDWENKPVYRILLLLATNQEFPQYDIHKKLKYDVGTVGDYVIGLKKLGLIKLHRRDKSIKNVMDKKNILRITFKGILVILSWQVVEYQDGVIQINSPLIDKIIGAHRNDWELFQEWNEINARWFYFGPLKDIKKYFSQTIYSNPHTLSKSINKICKNIEEKYEEYFWKLWIATSDPFPTLTKAQKTEVGKIMDYNLVESDDYYKKIANHALLFDDDESLRKDWTSLNGSKSANLLEKPTIVNLVNDEFNLAKKKYEQLLELKRYIDSSLSN